MSLRSVGSLSVSVLAAMLFAAAPLSASTPAAPADSLHGVVRDTAAQPLSGAIITIVELNRSVTADPSGGFVFRDVAPGRYTLSVRHLGYATASEKIVVPLASPFVMTLHVSPLRLAPVTVTASRWPSDPMESPLPTADVGQDKLRRDESVSLAHALDGMSGVRDITTGQQIGSPVVRGLEGPSVLILDNGSRLEDYSWSTEDGPSVDPRMADRVELIRGPASVLYGSNAIGGVINVMPAPMPDAIGQPGFTHIGGELYGATNNSEFGAIVRAEGANAGFGWQGTLIGRTAGNFHTPTGNPETPTGDIYDTGYDAINGDIGIGLKGQTANGALRFEHYGGEYGLLDGPPVQEDNTGGPLRKLNDNRVQAVGNFLVGTSRLEAKAQWQQHFLEEVVGNSRTGGEPPPIDLHLNTLSADVLLHHTRGDWLAGTVGMSGMYQTNTTLGVDPLVPDATTMNMGFFAFEQATRGKWSALAGLRGDFGQIEAQPNAELNLIAQTRAANAFSGDIGAVYRAMPQLALSVNIGRAFRAPTLVELFSNGPLPAEGIYITGLQTAVPEVSLDLDASARWVTPKFTAELSLYRNKVDNYLYLQATGDSSLVPNDEGCCDLLANYDYQQTSHATLTGLDLSLEWAVLPMWTVRGRFDLVNGTNDATDQPLSQMPPVRGDLAVEWHTLGAHAAYVSLGTHIVGEQTRLGPFDTPTSAYTLFELGGGITFPLNRCALQVDVRVTNLFDTTYTDFLSRYKLFAYGQGRNMIFRVSVPM
jgi:outer membrane receptor protein involved in Fe transport